MDDLISRQAAIDALNHECCCGAVIDHCGLETAMDIISGLPPTQTERIKGRWTRDNACSECGCQPWFSGDIHNYNFCPNCGAEMEVTI